MYGRGFQSPGGVQAVEGFCRRLDLRRGMRALEIGSGLGGSAFYLAAHHHLDVLGLDVSAAMVEISDQRRRRAAIEGVRFVRGDIRTHPLPEASFDLVWTRDCVLYVPEKHLVWEAAARCSKPNGQLFVTDFARGDGPRSQAFRAYVEGAGYHLQTLDEYAGSLRAAGFSIVEREDATPAFVAGLEQELARLEALYDAFLGEYDLSDYEYLVERWRHKIDLCRSGDLKWALFVARKA
jgi:phosphoethanolamine N-methyltransferase